jgi:hypothetical protein
MKLSQSKFLLLLRTCWRFSDKGLRLRLCAVYATAILGNCFAVTEPLIVGKIVETIAQGGNDLFTHVQFWIVCWIGVWPNRIAAVAVASEPP